MTICRGQKGAHGRFPPPPGSPEEYPADELPPLVFAHLVEREQLHPPDTGESGEKIGQLLESLRHKSNAGHQNMTNPDRFPGRFTEPQQGARIGAVVSGKFAAERRIGRFDVEQHEIGLGKDRFRNGESDGTGRIQRGVKPLLPAEAKHLTGKRRLQQRFPAGEGYPSRANEIPVFGNFADDLRRGNLPPPVGIPGIRIVAVETAQRTPLQKEHAAEAGTVDSPETLQRVNPATNFRHGQNRS